MLFHEYTNIHDNGVALWIDNGGAAEAVSAFTYYCYFGYAATNGGQLRSVAGNNSYGTYGSVASGYSASETPVTGTVYGSMLTLASAYTGTINPGDTITSNTGATAVVTSAQATSLYIAENAGGAFTQGSTFTTTSGGSGTISSVGGQAGFTLILNNLTALPVAGGSIQLAGDSSSYIIQSVSGGWANAASVITVVLAQQKVNTSAAGSVASIRYKFSLVRLTGHDFLNIGTGGVSSTNYPNTPTQQPELYKHFLVEYTT
jgi:preprotein translocase subunit YajC